MDSSAPASSPPTSSICARRSAAASPTIEIADRIERAVGTKWAGHQINQVDLHPSQADDVADRRVDSVRRSGGRGDRWSVRRAARRRGVGRDPRGRRRRRGRRADPVGGRRAERSVAVGSSPATTPGTDGSTTHRCAPIPDAIIDQASSRSVATRLHPDFGENPELRHPVRRRAGGRTRRCRCSYVAYGDESDPGSVPACPLDAPDRRRRVRIDR